MQIPGTNKVDVGSISTAPADSQVSCFAIVSVKNESYFADFLSLLDEYLPKFVFSKESLEMHESNFIQGLTSQSPLDKARNFLQVTHEDRSYDSGELGELLLYLFATEVQGAIKLASKIQSRGSNRVTLPGRDGSFVMADDKGNIFMLLGEAKVKPSCNDALKEAQKDMNNFWTSGDVGHEISLASTHMKSEMTEANYESLKAFFIEDNPAHSNLEYKNIIFVGFSFQKFVDLVAGRITSIELRDELKTKLTTVFHTQSATIAASTKPSLYCFVPFESVADARDAFAAHNFRTS